MNLDYQKIIGKTKIPNEAVECSMKVYDEFVKGDAPPLLVAQAQQGKTSTVMAVIDLFVGNCKAQKISYEVIYVISLSDTALKDQTYEKLQDAKFDEDENIKLIHHPDLRNGKFEINQNVERRLVIIDECHIALGKDRPLHKFFLSLGIEYGCPISAWEKQNNYVLSVSATPFPQILNEKIKLKAFVSVKLEVSDAYYSVKKAWDEGRFCDGDRVIKSGKVSPFFEACLNEFKLKCDSDGSGYLIVRVVDKGDRNCHQIIKNYVKKTYPDFAVTSFSAKEGDLPIKVLDNKIRSEPGRPHVIIIRAAWRAGKTLPTTKYIRLWIDTPISIDATNYQAIGRCFGYISIEDGHDKHKDTFKIYCDKKAIKTVMDFYESMNGDPQQVKNAGSIYNEGSLDVKIFWDIIFMTEKEYEADRNDLIKSGIDKDQLDLQNNSKSIKKDQCKNILNKTPVSKTHPYVRLDGPCENNESPEHKDNWDKVMALGREIMGKDVRNYFVKFIKLNQPIEVHSFTKDQVNDRSLMKQD